MVSDELHYILFSCHIASHMYHSNSLNKVVTVMSNYIYILALIFDLVVYY